MSPPRVPRFLFCFYKGRLLSQNRLVLYCLLELQTAVDFAVKTGLAWPPGTSVVLVV